MVQKLAWVFAGVFIVLGILGYVPGVTADGHLLGIFEVDPVHNIIHLVSGLIFAFAAWSSAQYSRYAFIGFGIVYALVTIVGFLQGDTVLGLFGVNMADNVLHLVIAAAALAVGFGMGGGEPAMREPRTQPMTGMDVGGSGDPQQPQQQQ